MSNPITVSVLKSLGNDTRLELVRKLVSEGCEVPSSEIINSCSDALQLAQPTLSHHFAQLVQAGVLIDRKSGTEKYYRLNTDLLQSIGIDPTKL